MNKRNVTLVSLAVGLVLFFGVNILANASLHSLRVDLTEGKLYSLSDGSKRIARGIEEPIRLYYYFSTEAAAAAGVKPYGERVRDVLEEFARTSDGKLLLETIDPEPFSEEEDRAKADGVVGTPTRDGDVLYLGLVGTNSTDDREVIKFFDPRKERFLEYDVARLIYALGHPQRKVVGFLSSLPLGGAAPNPMAPQAQQPWLIVQYVGSLFETRMIQPTATELPEDLDVLVVVHPKNFSNDLLFSIDQFVLGGGKAVFYVDPHCMADQSGADPSNPMAAMQSPKDSDLERLFTPWGFELVNQKVAADRANAIVQPTVEQGRQVQRSLVHYPRITDGFDREDPTTSFLEDMIFGTPGILRALPGAKTTFEPLVWTSEDSMELEVSQVQFFPDPAALLNQFVPGNESLTLAARVQGEVDTAFPDGPPGAPLAEEEPAEPPAFLKHSEGPIHVVVVADVDNLADPFWIQEQTLGGLSLGYNVFSDNGAFLLNSIENLAGGEDLISIRARGKLSRPLTKVDELRKEAEQRFLSKREALESELRETEQRIQELQREKAPGASELILSPEQEAELASFRQKQLETKKQLRDVQHALLKDIERLGTRIKWINIALVPALVTALAFALGAARTRRRTS